ncbi:MAG: corrinoid protein [Bacteroidales bacterium]|nr:corrinoid protein [Bacteroidales bacterium]MBN2697786.1 corrinoid protein [Bacteroidales bacterium]
MEQIQKLAHCVEFGKVNRASPYPPDMKDQDGADEISRQLLEDGIPAERVLQEGLIVGMERVGVKFRENKIFVPQVLMSAKAMSSAMAHLRPYFISGAVKSKGKFIIGTVEGDLHDIGKNLVSMMLEGNGFKVIDLGTNVKTERFLQAIDENPGSFLGLSALLTTTMVNMEKIVRVVKESYPELKVLIGGAPVNDDFRKRINADFYAPDPQGAVEYLKKIIA